METHKTHDSDAFQVPKAQIFSDITQQLYKAGKPGNVANAIIGIILVWVLWGSVPHDIALNWLAANLVINFLRFLLTIYVLKKDRINEQSWKRWAATHVVATGFISSVWGSAAFLLWVKIHLEFQLFFTLIVLGMTSAALPMVAIYLPSYLAYILPSTIPLFVVFLAQGDKLHVQMSILGCIYIFTMWATGRQYYAKIVESTRLRIQLSLLAHVDALTELPNRRVFDKRLEEEWRRMLRTRQPLSLLIIDVDNFKEYNDGLGHQAGDDCLKLIAKTIGEVFRRSGDFVARVGGEEFAALVSVTANDHATLLAERARQAVFDLGLPHPNPKKDQVTISVGLSTTIPNLDLSSPALYDAADEALYAAKNGGRDRVCVHNFQVETVR